MASSPCRRQLSKSFEQSLTRCTTQLAARALRNELIRIAETTKTAHTKAIATIREQREEQRAA